LEKRRSGLQGKTRLDQRRAMIKERIEDAEYRMQNKIAFPLSLRLLYSSISVR
jgi:hypothetical protein